MLARVTGRTRRSPHSHVLLKGLGNTLLASWSVTNIGGVSGSGRLDIEIFVPGGASVLFVGPNTSFGPGASVPLNVSGVLASPLVAGQTYNARLRLTVISPAQVGPGNTHDFTVTLAPPLITRTQIISEAQALASGVPFPDTRYFICLVMATHRLINDPAPGPYCDTLPGSSGWTWDQSYDWLIASGKVFTNLISG